jgi:hypothetical protein
VTRRNANGSCTKDGRETGFVSRDVPPRKRLTILWPMPSSTADESEVRRGAHDACQEKPQRPLGGGGLSRQARGVHTKADQNIEPQPRCFCCHLDTERGPSTRLHGGTSLETVLLKGGTDQIEHIRRFLCVSVLCVISRHQPQPEGGVSHSISVPARFSRAS